MKSTAVLLLIAAAVAAAAFRPAAGNAATFHGIVVASQHGRALVATPAGSLRSLRSHAMLGARLAVRGGNVVVVGRSASARIRGIVVRRLGATIVLSSRRNLIAIPDRAPRRLSAVAAAPAPGSIVDTRISIARDEIEVEDEHEVGRVEAGAIAVQATIAAVGAGTVTLDVQGRMLAVSLPGGLTLPTSVVGQTVTITLALARDDDEQGEDADEDRGDDDGGHGGHSGPGRGGGDDG